MPASSEPSSGSTTLSAAVASPSGAHAQSGCERYALEEGWKLSGLIHSPSFIGAIAARTALNVASGKRGGYLPRGSGYWDESGSQSPDAACQPSSSTNVSTPRSRAIGATFWTVA